MRKRIMLLVSAAMATLALLGSGTASAGDVTTATYEVNNAKQHAMTEHSKVCATGSDDVKGCVMPYGDILWLDDLEMDGWGVKLKWEDDDDNRKGECNANQGSTGGWARCNKNFTEGHEIWWWLVWYEDGEWHRSPENGFVYTTNV